MRGAGSAGIVCIALAIVVAPVARAAVPASCEEAVRTWAAGCPDLAQRCVQGVLCPPRSVILSVGCGESDRIQVEVSRSEHGFRKIGDLVVSPIVHSDNWAAEPVARRASFEAVAACVARGASPLLPGVTDAAGRDRAPVPWILIAGLACAVALLLLLLRKVPGPTLQRAAIGFLLLTAATFAFHRWAIPSGFFHQNGQGPFWIGFALEPTGSHSQYGPGFWEVFGRLARHADPEAGVFFVQAVLGAMAPALVWVLLKELPISGVLRWGAVSAVAMSPILGRVTQSESYCGICTVLLLGSAAALVAGLGRTGGSRFETVLAVATAGLLIAQAARITPASWAPAAFVPLVLLASGLSARQALWRAIGAALGIGLIVLVLDVREMTGILGGAVGQHWLPQLVEHLRRIPWAVAALPVALWLLVVASPDRSRAGLVATALLVTIVLIEGTRVVWEERPTINRAFLLMWLPVVLALSVALFGQVRPGPARGLSTAALLLLCFGLHVVTWRADTTLPTDSLEANWAREWRHLVPPHSTVVYVALSMASARDLPLYGAGTPVPIERWALTAGQEAPVSVERLGRSVFYYESSLCAAFDAGRTCQDMHRHFDLKLLASRTFPAVPSNRGERLTEQEITVGLYRIEGVLKPNAAKE